MRSSSSRSCRSAVKSTASDTGNRGRNRGSNGGEMRTFLQINHSKSMKWNLPHHSGISTSLIFLLVSIILTSSFPSLTSALRLNPYGGYEDVTITVTSEVPPIACQQLLQNLQGIFTSASSYLHEATFRKAYFHRVLIVLPPTWDSRACGRYLPAAPTSLSTVAKAQFRIGGEHPLFGHAPFTQQSLGCGKPGDFISMGYNYLMQYNETGHGPSSIADRAVVHEWAKLRYGIFEEKGYENDPIYPVAYHKGGSKGDSSIPTACTNGPLRGDWSEGCSKDPAHPSCIFIPSMTSNGNLSSSIMSFPNLPSVKWFCDSVTHNPNTPTKHNFLCDRKSVKEIIFSHPDFRNLTTRSDNRGPTPDFIIKQLIQPKYVLLIEETGNMNLRDVWKYLKLAIRKFIKYDLPSGTQIGLVTVSTDIRTLANMTSLDENLRGTLAEKLPNYPNIETSNGGVSLRKGITHAINMLKSNGQRAAGSVIILISQGTISQMDLETSLQLLKQEEVSIATIEYPSIGDGKISTLSQATRSPHYSIRESGVGSMSHMSTYIQLVNAIMDIQRFFTKGISSKWPTLIHQEEFKGDSPKYVESSFSFDASQSPAEFYIYIPTPIDPKVNTVELTSPTGIKFTDQLSYLHDINVIKIDAVIDQPGIWRYRIERLGDSHQSHFVQVLTSGGTNTEDMTVRIFSNVDETRVVNLTRTALILYAEVKRGNSPVLGADVLALINGEWSVNLLDSGNGDPDLTRGDGIYSRYIIPPSSFQTSILDITVKVTTSPYGAWFLSESVSAQLQAVDGSSRVTKPSSVIIPTCCGSDLFPAGSLVAGSLKPMPYNERIISSYMIKVTSTKPRGSYNPSRIGNLRVKSSYQTEVTLEFTSPGDDYDQGLPEKYIIYASRSREIQPVYMQTITETFQAGTLVNITLSLSSYGWYFFQVVAEDRFRNGGQLSNVVEVKLIAPTSDYEPGGTLPRDGGEDTGDENTKLSSTALGFIIGGSVLCVLLILAIILICYCRRKGGKTMGSTETKISTISDTKAPIHWSASELLGEHEKRQSIYAPSNPPQGHPQNYSNYYEKAANNGPPPSHHQMTHHHLNESPESSRSFRSISENNRKTSLDSMSGRRATLTDYDSCASDKTLKSAKGQTDYDSCVEENYRTIESYSVLPPYRNSAGNPGAHHPTTNNILSSNHLPQRIPNNNSHMQYNPNVQGSLTSVNSKRRNITMV